MGFGRDSRKNPKMLLQSHAGKVELLPGPPFRVAKGTYPWQLMARAGFGGEH